MTETIFGERYNPCKGCPDRDPGCWGSCTKEPYLKWKAEQELIRQNRKNYMSNSTPIWKHGDRDPRKR